MTRDDAPVREECVPHPVNNCTMKTREKVGPHVISSSVICSSCFSVGTWWGRCACPWPWRAAPRSPGRSALECPSQSAWMLRGSSASSGQGRLAPQSRSGLLSFSLHFSKRIIDCQESTCRDVPVETCELVDFTKCQEVPKKFCQDVSYEECKQSPEEVCWDVPGDVL